LRSKLKKKKKRVAAVRAGAGKSEKRRHRRNGRRGEEVELSGVSADAANLFKASMFSKVFIDDSIV
jgi:hypothetical protein